MLWLTERLTSNKKKFAQLFVNDQHIFKVGRDFSNTIKLNKEPPSIFFYKQIFLFWLMYALCKQLEHLRNLGVSYCPYNYLVVGKQISKITLLYFFILYMLISLVLTTLSKRRTQLGLSHYRTEDVGHLWLRSYENWDINVILRAHTVKASLVVITYREYRNS